MNRTLEKLAHIMCWDVGTDESASDVFQRESGQLNALPNPLVIDVVYEGGLDRWALTQVDVDSEEELIARLMHACNLTVICPCFRDKLRREVFPPLYNFFTYTNKLQQNGRLAKECTSIASRVWNGEIARTKLNMRCAKMFSVKPNQTKFDAACKEMRGIWGFSNTDIDALRYFVCQCKQSDQNPSLNKSLYLYGETKQTGKSTVARAFATVLNADDFGNFGKYESTFSNEMGFGAHDLPLACLYNCVILDEAMPKDSRKSYGSLKSVFTGGSFTYNPKFQQPITIKAVRNYIMTSNEQPNDFIQDRFERRFYAIEFKNKPGQLSFSQIYKLIRDFCIHATPRLQTQEWYDSFDLVSGVAEKDKCEVMQEILSSLSFFQSRSTCTVKQVANYIFKNEPTREQKKSVETAMFELADDCRYASNKYMFDARKVAVKISLNVAGQAVDEDAF